MLLGALVTAKCPGLIVYKIYVEALSQDNVLELSFSHVYEGTRSLKNKKYLRHVRFSNIFQIISNALRKDSIWK